MSNSQKYPQGRLTIRQFIRAPKEEKNYSVIKFWICEENIDLESLRKSLKNRIREYFDDESSNTPWFKKRNDLRKFNTLINRIRFKHYNLNEYLAKKDLMDSWRCERGEEVENINHVVFLCNKYEKERKGLFRRMKIRNTQIRYCMLELLGDKE